MLFKQPVGRQFKWWSLEARFKRPLIRREVRYLQDLVDLGCSGFAGEDGLVLKCWYNSYPGFDDEQLLRDTIRKVGVDARVRAAAYGSGCLGGVLCENYMEGDLVRGKCAPGRPESCSTLGWTEDDWCLVSVHPSPP